MNYDRYKYCGGFVIIKRDLRVWGYTWAASRSDSLCSGATWTYRGAKRKAERCIKNSLKNDSKEDRF